MFSFARVWKTKEVRTSLLFVFAMLVIFRVVAHVPVPGVDPSALMNFFQGNQFFGLLNIFSGGTLENFSVVALGLAPYITASIIFQLLGMIVPKLEEMQKEEQGRNKINQWSRMLTVPLALLQGYGLVLLFEQQSGSTLFAGGSANLMTTLLVMVSMTAGTIFLMWMGELISEKNMGNGISILIFAGIIAGLPSYFSQSLALYDRSQLITAIIFVVLTLVTIAAVVIMQEAQRNIPVQYARQMRGSRLSGAVSSNLPIKLNIAGVIPIIFAISIILFPSVVAQFFMNARTPALRAAAEWALQMFQNQLVYGIVYFALVFAFTFFYTSVIFHPDQVAENLQKQSGFVPGIRPGKPTAEYIAWVTNRILLAGALFLSLIAVLPLLAQQITGNATLVIGGTSMLIVVNVVIETLKQVEAQMSMHEYEM
ncbi:preprotein translocase subunit SecY [Candidatus Uhrbacteria bacterium RIFOXYB12_FULL_58_10]|uniref:Protein translocase subunit SecY n=1 Tax=Candidatus Uhrbacteria bacterium RIFOXYB2_FULL_57_15 TaxID=1802422 RepID=A0A1F7W9I3_9BACT|nr:MAG: preprotein translocase subunit SecY [Candidatus Uhrbacteria bacterium RIFOXYB12_FULL_58_10]OGL99018.1 MAG: preprotein translocase subunit SecY [Candidatus Uhrbacteria bacterium RIFOXYB2_FULL_57_15]OGM00238.1 MAG: preprotein translocase subunit SecY [Candidatus Uhrbacteria bacterium RIFOXYC12_FULL_57_11]